MNIFHKIRQLTATTAATAFCQGLGAIGIVCRNCAICPRLFRHRRRCPIGSIQLQFRKIRLKFSNLLQNFPLIKSPRAYFSLNPEKDPIRQFRSHFFLEIFKNEPLRMTKFWRKCIIIEKNISQKIANISQK